VILFVTSLLSSFDNFYDAPNFGLAHGTSLHDANGVAIVAIVGFVMGVKLFRKRDELAILGVLHATRNAHGDRFFHR